MINATAVMKTLARPDCRAVQCAAFENISDMQPPDVFLSRKEVGID